MALPDTPLPDVALIQSRHLQFRKELLELERQFERQEQQHCVAREEARNAILAESKKKRDEIASHFGQMAIPEVVELLIIKDQVHALETAEAEFNRTSAERKSAYEHAKQQYMAKWRDYLFAPASEPSPLPQVS